VAHPRGELLRHLAPVPDAWHHEQVPTCQTVFALASDEPEGAPMTDTRPDPTAWPAGKTFGELSPAQRRAAVTRAAAQLQAELDASAEHIGRIMDGAESDPADHVAELDTPSDGPEAYAERQANRRAARPADREQDAAPYGPWAVSSERGYIDPAFHRGPIDCYGNEPRPWERDREAGA
jgi:hypothetical protein